MFVIFELGVIGPERRGDTDKEVLRLSPDIALHRFEGAGIDVLRQTAPSSVDDGDRFMNRIIENGGLTIGVGHADRKIFFRGEESVGLKRFIEIFRGDPLDVHSMGLVREH